MIIVNIVSITNETNTYIVYLFCIRLIRKKKYCK